MSGNDKTGDRLVASIRKTKAGAGKTQVGTSRPRQRAPATAQKPVAPAEGGSAGSGDAYQCGRRVWPD